MAEDIPLQGTVIGMSGKPEDESRTLGKPPVALFPSLLVKNGLNGNLLHTLEPSGNFQIKVTMSDVKECFEKGLKSPKMIMSAKGTKKILREERMAVRRMMSRYWFNASPFS
jgi:hypothetical protein